MAITKRGKTYQVNHYVELDENGKSKYHRKGGFKTKKEAKLYEERLVYQINTEGPESLSEDLFETIYQLWLTAYKNTVEITTYDRTKEIFTNWILPKFGKCNIREIKLLDCQKAINEWFKKYKSVKKLKNYTSTIFKYAQHLELTTNNPMENVLLPKIQKQKNENFWTVDELKQFLKIVKQKEPFKNYIFFHLLAYTGVRKGELYALYWEDVNFIEDEIVIKASLAKSSKQRIRKLPKNSTSIRKIKLNKETMNLLGKWKKEQAKEFFKLGINTFNISNFHVFSYLNKQGEIAPLQHEFANRILNRIIKQNDLKKITPHGFRHTHGTLLIESGADIKNTSARLGHKNIQTTLDFYGHATEQGQQKTLDKFTEYLG